jgi:primosomal protein N' (replication factor Y) (superfamily II helicase)
VGERPAIVVATPGVEPVAAHGYAAAVLLDAEALLARADLRAGEEALRRWRSAAALVRPAGEGGVVVVCAAPSEAAVQALVRGDPGGFAAHELEQRGSLAPGGPGGRLGLPPAVIAATLRGAAEAVAGFLAVARLPGSTQVDGPVPVEDDGRRPGLPPDAPGGPGAAPAEQVRYVLRVPLADGPELARALHAAAAVRSARREPGPVRMQIDPRDLG